MVISFKGIQLCDDEQEWQNALRSEGSKLFQRIQLLDAQEAAFADKGNASVRGSFSVTKEHASQEAAELYFLTHPQALNGLGDMLVTTGYGGDTQTLALAGAYFEAQSIAPPIGAVTQFSYSFHAPAVTVVDGIATPEFIASGSVAFDQSVAVAVEFIASGSVAFDQAVGVSVEFIPSGSLAFDQELRLEPEFIASGSVAFDQELGIAPEFIASGSVAFDQNVAPAFAAHATLGNGLIRAYKHGDLTEELGNADLTATGTPVVVATGKDGDCYDYNGSTDYHETDWYPSGSFSVGVWVNLDDISDEAVFACHDAADHRCYITVTAGVIRVAVGSQFHDANVTMSLSTWHHVALSYNGATAKLFIDATLRYSFAPTFTGASADPLLLGLNTTSNQFFHGRLDEIYIWNRALTDGGVSATDDPAGGEIADLYNSGAGLFY